MTRDAGRNDAHARFGEVVLEGDLVVVLEGADLDGLHLADAEVQQHRALGPRVHRPFAVIALGGHAHLSAIQEPHRPHDSLAVRLVAEEAPVLERRVHLAAQILVLITHGGVHSTTLRPVLPRLSPLHGRATSVAAWWVSSSEASSTTKSCSASG